MARAILVPWGYVPVGVLTHYKSIHNVHLCQLHPAGICRISWRWFEHGYVWHIYTFFGHLAFLKMNIHGTSMEHQQFLPFGYQKKRTEVACQLPDKDGLHLPHLGLWSAEVHSGTVVRLFKEPLQDQRNHQTICNTWQNQYTYVIFRS